MKTNLQPARPVMGFARSVVTAVPSGAFRRSVALVALALAAALPPARAAIPNNTTNTALYQRGYLDITRYNAANGTPVGQRVTVGNTTNVATITSTTAGINQALFDAYHNNKILYFPTGTYVINNTLKAHTGQKFFSTVFPGDFQTPRNKHIAIVGSTTGARPVIKLAAGAPGFNSKSAPKEMLEFRNFEINAQEQYTQNPPLEISGQGYYQMLRGVDIDCNGSNQNQGAIGLYFNSAQGSSIENVTITATGAHTGLHGMPNAGAGTINLKIIGGDYGIDNLNGGVSGRSVASTYVAGLVLQNQAVCAVRHDAFGPLTIVGFDITTNPGVPALQIQNRPEHNNAGVILVDGRITLGSTSTPAIDNSVEKNFYARNVYITGGNDVIKKATSTITRTGTWKRIVEYGFCDQGPAGDSYNKISQNLINGSPNTSETNNILSNVSAGDVPTNLHLKHVWGRLPSVDDIGIDAVDAYNQPEAIRPGEVSSGDFQDLIDRMALNGTKIFLRAGVYKLDGPINLRRNTVLYGADRNLTRIEVSDTWADQLVAQPALRQETPMITTDDDPAGTTYIGDLSIGVHCGYPPGDADDPADPADWFTALHWRMGAESMVHVGPVYRAPYNIGTQAKTNPHSLIKITGSGGGRWYTVCSIKTYTSWHSSFRVLKVDGTEEPLWIYALNPEHQRGDAYVEFINAKNIRIYSVKSEFEDTAAYAVLSPILRFNNVENVALFGHGSLRNAVTNRGVDEFVGANTDKVLAALITPQEVKSFSGVGHTLRENISSGIKGINYPNVVALYKWGAITDADDALMFHSFTSY